MTQSTVRYETPAEGVARIVLARADKHNAINPQLIFDVNEAFNRAVRDEAVKVIILGADGRNFSAGHDIADTVADYQAAVQANSPGVSTWSDFAEDYTHGWYAAEKEAYLESARRWRNLSKPTICTVQGKCIAGALIFAWVCDIIVAAKDAQFSDPTVTFGVSGVEWLGHPWELGPRKAKEFLFTSDIWSAEEAHRLGMVNHVVEREELDDFALAMAKRIALKPAFALKLAKEAVNKTLDTQGQMNAIDQAFSLHHLCHNQNFRKFGYGMDTSNLPKVANVPKKVVEPG
ncbi:enoyl-CoA hydratase [Novosphingobium barchaimii LL02]|uniref:Enoyl-CoA hydratase n=1 Tax=Novosphingobium barchaimii LL02 TaxID=1114963 RepID=A0A0J7XK03_9SPHN|nr:enoyl-CoA hydratase [Novosphingobium barchaimii]KMS52022.1 enoyl-CoA hydratase [Novosphingobium barchaimii LL02]